MLRLLFVGDVRDFLYKHPLFILDIIALIGIHDHGFKQQIIGIRLMIL